LEAFTVRRSPLSAPMDLRWAKKGGYIRKLSGVGYFWRAAPPVLEWDEAGHLVSAWGGPGDGYEWPDLEHGIYLDHEDNVWLGGGGEKDAQILKFTRGGRFLMQVGRKGQNTGSNDTRNLGAAANMTIDRATGELYVADGYVNHRVIVFDAATGAYKRHWGAYGRTPDDSYFTRAGERLPSPFSGAVQFENAPSQYDPSGPPPPQFRIVHAVRIANDGLVYVCDRTNDRIQVFRKDGTFVKEQFIARRPLGSGSVWDISFSTDPAQTYLIVIDGTNQQVYIVDRQTLDVRERRLHFLLRVRTRWRSTAAGRAMASSSVRYLGSSNSFPNASSTPSTVAMRSTFSMDALPVRSKRITVPGATPARLATSPCLSSRRIRSSLARRPRPSSVSP